MGYFSLYLFLDTSMTSNISFASVRPLSASVDSGNYFKNSASSLIHFTLPRGSTNSPNAAGVSGQTIFALLLFSSFSFRASICLEISSSSGSLGGSPRPCI